MMFEYDVAAWHATDAVEELKPDRVTAPVHMAKKVGEKWEVWFGKLNDHSFEGRPPLEEKDFYPSAAKAIELGLHTFGKPNRPYDVSVIPAEGHGFYIYFLPAQTKNGVYPLGADVRYRIAADGSTILEGHPVHKTILEFDFTKIPSGAKTAMGFHTHVLSLRLKTAMFFMCLRGGRRFPRWSRP